MQFRERRRVIQVIRTVYDPAIKRGRSEVVGRIDREDPVLDDVLQAACTPEELSEIKDFLAQRLHIQSRQEARDAAADLPLLMRQAEAWFRDHPDADTGPLAAEIMVAWKDLEKALHKAGVTKVKRRA